MSLMTYFLKNKSLILKSNALLNLALVCVCVCNVCVCVCVGGWVGVGVDVCRCGCLRANHFDVIGLGIKVDQGLPCVPHYIPRSNGKSF